jgi:sec-independent protein translocase protein TatA
MGALTPAHLLIILVVALVVLGPGKLPETGAALGTALRRFRDAVDGRDEAGPPSNPPTTPPTTPPTEPPPA